MDRPATRFPCLHNFHYFPRYGDYIRMAGKDVVYVVRKPGSWQ
jgi:hypothetical protein